MFPGGVLQISSAEKSSSDVLLKLIKAYNPIILWF